MTLSLTTLSDTLAICRLPSGSPLPSWLKTGSFFAVVGTTDEVSIVCAETAVPEGVVADKGWRALKIDGPLDFSLVGILAAVSTSLASGAVSIFAISTYDTDYVLVKERQLEDARRLLTDAGHTVRDSA